MGPREWWPQLGASSILWPYRNKESTMLKKLVVGAIAAGVLAVPLAGVAGADPSADNPGTPGNFPGNIPPGQRVSSIATDKTLKPPGTSVSDIAHDEGFTSVGDAVNNFAPGHLNK